MSGAQTAATWLFVPGDRPDRFDRAATAGADEVIVDLEDAVAPQAKDLARRAVRGRLAAGHPCWVRVNAPGTEWHDQDLAALDGLAALRGVLVPKAEETGALVRIAGRLPAQAELVALVESARGVLHAPALAECPAVARLAFGAVDFALDIDADATRRALLPARGALVIASRAAGKPPPVDSVTTRLGPAVAAADAHHARALGFGGKLLIHPGQVAPVAAAFRPDPGEVRWARAVLEAAGGAGGGAIRFEGRMIDRPVVERARRIVARADAPAPGARPG